MKEIKLTKGLITQVDDDMFEYLNQFKWHAKKDDRTYYVARLSKVEEGHKTIRMHRQITNCPKGLEVDHIDHNGLNNQKYNLRICNHSQNQCNRKGNGSSKYLGVSIEKNGNYKRIRASIQTNKKSINLGCFYTEKQAALAYDQKAKELHGEFANLNFK